MNEECSNKQFVEDSELTESELHKTMSGKGKVVPVLN
jgi:hypothetical protein